MAVSTIERRAAIYQRSLIEQAEGATLAAEKAIYLATASKDALISTLLDPYGSGSSFSVVGTPPAPLALAAGGRIVAGAAAPVAGQSYTIVIRAQKGLRAVEEPLTFTAQAAAGTPTPTPSPGYVVPVIDWRAIATAVTDLAGNPLPAMLAQQANAGTKTRGASFNTSTAAETGVIIDFPAGATEILTSVVGLPASVDTSTTGTQPIIEYSIDGKATWQSSGYALQSPTGSASSRRQAKLTTAAQHSVRLRFPPQASVYAVKPLWHRWPASGKAPTLLTDGNSELFYPYGSEDFETALIAAHPGYDPLVFNWGQPSASPSDILAKATLANNVFGKIIQYVWLDNCGISSATSSYPSERPFASLADSAKTTLRNQANANVDACLGFGWTIIASPGGYRSYAELPAPTQYLPALPAIDSSDAQANGMLPFCDGITNGVIAAKVPGMLNKYGWPAIDHYGRKLLNRGLLDAKGVHYSTSGEPIARAWAGPVFGGLWLKGVMPTPEPDLRAASAEVSLRMSDYAEAVYAVKYLTPGVPNDRPIARQDAASRVAAILPLALLKEANIAYAAAAVAGTQTAKDSATAANNAAKAGNAATATVASAYGNTVNLYGTDELTARIAAIGSRTILQRIGIDFGQATPSPTTFNGYIAATGALALINTAGAASGIGVTVSGLSTNGAANGIAVVAGAAPNDITASNNRSYSMTGTNGVAVATFSGAAVSHRFRLTFYSARKEADDRSMTITVAGGGGSQISRTINGGGDGTTANTVGDYVVIDGIAPNSDGTFTITSAHVGAVTAVPWTSLVIEEYAV